MCIVKMRIRLHKMEEEKMAENTDKNHWCPYQRW